MGWQREIDYTMMHAHDIYESMQMHQNVSTKARRDKEIHLSLVNLALAVAQ